MTNQSGLLKFFLCATVLLCASCNSQPGKSADSENEKLALSNGEQLYQGLIISGDMWDVYVADLDDLKDPTKRYRIKFDRNEFKDNSLINQLHKEGVKIDWPSRMSKGSVVWAKFIAKPDEPFDDHGKWFVTEIDNKLFVKKVISYSSDLDYVLQDQ